MESRRTPDGVPPSARLQKAHTEKMNLRSVRQQQFERMRMGADVGLNVKVGNATTTWSQLGPQPLNILNGAGNWGNWVSGRTAAVAVDPGDSTGNTVYAGTAYGGVWKSTNAAAANAASVTWTPITDSQPTLTIGAIALKPGDIDGTNHCTRTILAGTGEAKRATDSYQGMGILRSTDCGQTWNLVTQTAEGKSFAGLGWGRFAFSTTNPSLVVAAATPAGSPNNYSQYWVSNFYGTSGGVYYSTDSGASWHFGTVSEGFSYADARIGATSVIFNPAFGANGTFFAAFRFHGIYQSTDGITWTKGTQPSNGSTPVDVACTTTMSTSCPFYRGELSVVPGRNEMYLWVTSGLSGTSTTNNYGVFQSTDGGASWRALTKTGIDTCGTNDACGSTQTYFYNQTILAVKNPTTQTNTDLYLGGVNIFKCTLNPADSNSNCGGAEPNSFMNITKVYDDNCGWGGDNGSGKVFARVHPDQHGMASLDGTKIYFANDGGVYRTLNGAGLNTGTCANAPLNGLPYDDLNANIGPTLQFVHGSPDVSTGDHDAFVVGAQDNGSSMTSNTILAGGKNFNQIRGGDGGYTAVKPDTGDVYTSYVYVDITKCSQPNAKFNCQYSYDQVVLDDSDQNQHDVGGDTSAFYTPWLIDPQNPNKLLVGTCRVWRGSSNAPYSGSAISNNFQTGDTTTCAGHANIYSLAVGGTATSNGSQVIYAGTSNNQIWKTTAADNGPTSWQNVSPSSLVPGPGWQPSATFRISGIAMVPSDPNTVYATVQAYMTAHVIKSTNGGTSWTNISGDLPDVPTNSIVLDPEDPTVVYVGTDVGVFVTSNGGTNWTEVGPAAGTAGFLPNVPVTRVTIQKYSDGTKTLWAVTYGRGVWRADLAGQGGVISFVEASPLDFGSVAVGGTMSRTVHVKNTGTGTMSLATLTLTGDYSKSADGCTGTTLAVNDTCSVNVIFSPAATGTRTGTLTVSSSTAGVTPAVLYLTGTGAAAGITWAPTSVNFGNIKVTSNDTQTVTLTNSGTYSLNIAAITVTGTALTKASDTCGATLAAGSNCAIGVKFAPVAAGTFSGTLAVNSDAPANPSVTLTGKGVVATASADKTAVAFNTKAVQSTNSQTVTLTNAGELALNIASIVVTGDSSFTKATTCGATLNASANCTITVTFAPTTKGAKAGTLTVTTDSTDAVGAPTAPISIALSGKGQDFTLPAPPVSSKTVTAGQPASYDLAIPADANGFDSAINFSCAANTIPTGTTCTFNPATVTPGTNAASVTLTISTTARSVTQPTLISANIQRNRQTPLMALWMALPGMALLLPAAAKRRKASAWMILALIALAVLMSMTACGGGGGSSSTPPGPTGTGAGTYTVTVNATSGSLVHQTNVTLIVQ